MHGAHPPAAEILTALDANPTVHVTDLAACVDGDPRLVDDVCHDLESDGLIRRRPAGRYSITSKGERRLRRLLVRR